MTHMHTFDIVISRCCAITKLLVDTIQWYETENNLLAATRKEHV